MIVLVGTGVVITVNMMYGILTFGIFATIQPWSPTLKCIGVFIGIGAYALLPFAVVGFFA